MCANFEARMKKLQAAASRRSRRFRNHSEIFAVIAKIGKLNFRYGSENLYGRPQLTDKIGNSKAKNNNNNNYVLFLFIIITLFY